MRTYLPRFSVADTEASNTIRFRHLLNHTSGLSEAQSGGMGVRPSGTSAERAVRDLHSAPVTASVGKRFQYFNLSYTTLALVIELRSGRTMLGQIGSGELTGVGRRAHEFDGGTGNGSLIPAHSSGPTSPRTGPRGR